MTRYYLELSNAREHKFYELVLEDAALHLRYGRIGTDGQRQSRTHASPEAAQKEADKRLGEKRKKGYVDAVMGEREKQDVIPPRLRLPDLLRPHRSEIEATLRPSVHLVRDGQSGRPWSCKVGGVPYREQGQPWPTTPDGQALAFLAQLHFADLPVLDGYPTTGLVQFFILDDDLMGCDFDSGLPLDEVPQTTYRVLFHPEVIQDEAALDLSVIERVWDVLPHDPAVEVPLRGYLAQDILSANDRLFDGLVTIDFLDKTEGEDGEIVGDLRFYACGDVVTLASKVGGHPDFTQTDPRGTEDPHLLLFQLDSETEWGVMWGDAGIGNFFIRPEDLAARDFSRVVYHWDCH
ncbi:DUF1963 domain-containing protein [Deinococcus marmoris]|uniref:DUF1963 domain-containing protein n=1 Tax=Deinococcus marmoris TaxID=249408 RepID=UPI00096A8647|nr:DUF1963 domain-containing protein [Deinococcus marmoris]